MKIDLGMRRYARNKDPKLAIIRKASTAASTRHGIGGRPKTRNAPRPITLATAKT